MSKRMGLVQPKFLEEMPSAPILNVTLGDSLDWVSKGAVNPIKDQGQCGSCWAFSTACNLEGTGFVSSSKLVSVSEQNIVDCDHSDDGCDGGLPSSALEWSTRHGGVASEQAYPYTARDGNCRNNVGTVVHNTGYQRIATDENQIAQALEKYGPLSIAVDANGFNGYNGGVLRNPSCSKTQLNHAINIVGFGVDQIPYWKIRNSWGSNWGEEGYIRVYRGDCICGVCSQVVTATGVTVSGSPTPPTPPTPTPPAPTPPGPTPCVTCEYNSECPSGSCEYPHWWSTSGCCSGGPSPPPPSPPGPTPCVTCEWNSECPAGEDCYYPSSSATSGCCSSGPPIYTNSSQVAGIAAELTV